MTGLAGQVAMLAYELKAGCQVIEGIAGLGCETSCRRKHEGNRQQEERNVLNAGGGSSGYQTANGRGAGSHTAPQRNRAPLKDTVEWHR
jgi:hypothetical protein